MGPVHRNKVKQNRGKLNKKTEQIKTCVKKNWKVKQHQQSLGNISNNQHKSDWTALKDILSWFVFGAWKLLLVSICSKIIFHSLSCFI